MLAPGVVLKNYPVVYKFTYMNPSSKYDGKIYVGKTKHFSTRLQAHRKALRTGRSCPGWMHRIRTDDHVTDFDSYFKVEILEKFDKNSDFDEALDAAEIKWISHYDCTNPDVGFNTLPGGTQCRPKWFSSVNFKQLKSYFVHDISSGEIDLIISITDLSRELNIEAGMLISSCKRRRIIKNHLMLLSPTYDERAKWFWEHTDPIWYDLMDHLSGDTYNLQYISTKSGILIQHYSFYMYQEKYINRHFCYDGFSDDIEDTMIAIKERLKMLKRLNVCYSRNPYDYSSFELSPTVNSDRELFGAIVVDSSNYKVYAFEKLHDARLFIHVREEICAERMRHPYPIRDGFYIFYPDMAAMDNMRDMVHKNTDMKSTKERAAYFKYLKAYYAARNYISPTEFYVN